MALLSDGGHVLVCSSMPITKTTFQTWSLLQLIQEPMDVLFLGSTSHLLTYIKIPEIEGLINVSVQPMNLAIVSAYKTRSIISVE